MHIGDGPGVETDGIPMKLVVLNAVALHRASPHYSAQGIGVTIAGAVEAAWRGKWELLFVECARCGAGETEAADHDGEGNQTSLPAGDVHMGGASTDEQRDRVLDEIGGREEIRRSNAESLGDCDADSLWEVAVPVVSSSTKTFGLGNDRSWMEKTVKLNAVVERWCEFTETP